VKVLHVVQSPGFAGVEQHVIRLAVAQAARGDDVTVIGGDQDRMSRAAGGAVEVRRGSNAQEAAAEMVRCMRRRPDVVHANMTVAETISAVVMQRSPVPLVATRHFARARGRNALLRAVSGLTARRVDAQIAISAYVAERINGESVVVHPGVARHDDAAPPAQREPVVLVAQRLEAEKETDVAVTTFARSGLAARGWRLVVAGDGSERATLEALADELGVGPATQFLGHRSDVRQLMDAASVLLAPCRIEGLGLTVLEAMAGALPVVAVGSGGHLETVGSVPDAALHEPGDATGAGALLRALADDPDRRTRYGAGLQAAQRAGFTPERQAELTAEVYEAVL
jgi:glycosyltransferase involved in cell wall biosynthesis